MINWCHQVNILSKLRQGADSAMCPGHKSVSAHKWWRLAEPGVAWPASVARIIAKIILASGDINFGKHAIYGSGARPQHPALAGRHRQNCCKLVDVQCCTEMWKVSSLLPGLRYLLCLDPGPGIKLLAKNEPELDKEWWTPGYAGSGPAQQ